MRATYRPAPAPPGRIEWLVVAAPAGLGGDGELTLCLQDRRSARAEAADRLRDVRQRWAAAARVGHGTLEIGA